MWDHAVGLAAMACFAALGALMLRQVRLDPVKAPRVVVVAVEPTRVEVSASLPEPPRRAHSTGESSPSSARRTILTGGKP